MSIVIKDAVKSYDGKKNVINNLTVSFADNGIYGIVGRSGAGKSTLINILSGLDTLTSGQILFDGVDMTVSSASIRENISVIYQEYHLLPELNVYQNIEIAVKLSGGVSSREEIVTLMEKLGIEKLANRNIVALSGGEKQRVAIARAYLSSKKVIVADEPTGNLDYENGAYVFNMLREISKEKLVIVVSHDMELMTEYIENIYELYDGTLHKSGCEDCTETEISADDIIIQKNENKSISIDQNITARECQNVNPTAKKSVKSCGLGTKYYARLAFGFLTKKKVALVCMMIISCISLSLFTVTFAVLNYNPVDIFMQEGSTSEIKVQFGSGDMAKIDDRIYDKYYNEFAIGVGNDFMAKNLAQDSGELGDKRTNVTVRGLYELPSVDIGLEIVAGAMPKDCSELIISSNMINNILFLGNIVDVTSVDEYGNYGYKNFDKGNKADVNDIIGTKLYLIDKEVTIVGAYADDLGDEWNIPNPDKVFFGKGMIDYIKQADPITYAESILGDADRNFDGGYGSFGYNIDAIDMEKFEGELVDIEGVASKMPTANDEVILECPVFLDGDQLYFHSIGDYVSLINNGLSEIKYKIVGYYTSGEDYDELFYINSEDMITDTFTATAYMTADALVDYTNLFDKTYASIAFGAHHGKDFYKGLFDAGFLNINIDSITETYLPMSIILVVAILLILVVSMICGSVLLKGNFKSMAILSGLGAKAHHIAIITSIMVAVLSIIIVAISMPLAVGLNALYNIYASIGMAIGALEVFTSIGVILGIYLSAVGVCSVILTRNKVVNSLRVE